LNAPLDSIVRESLNDFENFLSHSQINLSYGDDILAIRSSLRKPKIFLKRSFNAIMANAYNPLIISLQRANIDIQFILDPYFINYINKSQRGISKLMQEAIEETRAGNFTIKQKLQHIGHKFITGSEISAQEAAQAIGMCVYFSYTYSESKKYWHTKKL